MPILPMSAGPETLREQFAEHGHILMTGVYDPSLAVPAIGEALSGVLRYNRPRNSYGTQVGTVEPLSTYLRQPNRTPNLNTILGDIDRGSRLLGCSLEVSRKLFTQVVRMIPNAEGPYHIDLEDLAEAVAITSLEATSQLAIDGQEDRYTIAAGTVAYLDHSRELPHQAFGDPLHQRTGLVAAKYK